MISISILMLALLLNSCNENEAPPFPVSFELRLLNKNNEPAEIFGLGEDIKFVFEITNKTSEDIYLSNFQPELVCPRNSNFFRVFIESNESGGWADLGRPCIPINCSYEGAFKIDANSFRKIEYYWADGCDSNSELDIGKYKTGFAFDFEVNGGLYNGMKSSQVFEIRFTVQ